MRSMYQSREGLGSFAGTSLRSARSALQATTALAPSLHALTTRAPTCAAAPATATPARLPLLPSTIVTNAALGMWVRISVRVGCAHVAPTALAETSRRNARQGRLRSTTAGPTWTSACASQAFKGRRAGSPGSASLAPRATTAPTMAAATAERAPRARPTLLAKSQLARACARPARTAGMGGIATRARAGTTVRVTGGASTVTTAPSAPAAPPRSPSATAPT
mmetsp:Transcript_10344/g.24474  ORF Transcript_10344/g.24474 Transcript_10344/m.24474 type:complete len:222 (+) Transcript_10344:2765-3430(+)